VCPFCGARVTEVRELPFAGPNQIRFMRSKALAFLSAQVGSRVFFDSIKVDVRLRY